MPAVLHPVPPTETPRPGKTDWWIAAALALLVVMVLGTFIPVLRGGYVGLDDGNNIYLNAHLGGLSWDRVVWAFTDLSTARRYMPFGWLGFSAVFTWQGLNPAGYHAASLAWHLIGTVALFATARNILASRFSAAGSGRTVLAAATMIAAAWALHPLRTETVAWASGLLYSEAAAWALVSVWFWSGRWTNPHRSGWYATGAFLALAVSLLTYPIAFGLPIVCWLLDIVAGRSRVLVQKKHLPFTLYRPGWDGLVLLLIAVGVLLANLAARADTRANFAPVATLAGFGFQDRLMQALYVWGRYILRLVCPTGISPVYTDLYSLHPPSLGVSLTAGLTVALLALVGWQGLRGRISLIPLLAYSVMILPFLGLLEHPWVAHDRYALLLHPILLMAAGFWWLNLKAARVRLGVAACCCAGIAWGAIEARSLVGVWADPASLVARLGQQLPADAWAGYYLGKVPASDLFLAGRFDEMWQVLDQAEKRSPGWSAEPARAEFRALLRQHEDFLQKNWPGRAVAPVALLHFLHGRNAESRHDWLTARAHFQAALLVYPQFNESWVEDAWCELEMSNPAPATAAMEQAILLGEKSPAGPREVEFWRVLSAIYQARGEPALAGQAEERARQRQGAR